MEAFQGDLGVTARSGVVEKYFWDMTRTESSQAESYMRHLNTLIGTQDRYAFVPPCFSAMRCQCQFVFRLGSSQPSPSSLLNQLAASPGRSFALLDGNKHCFFDAGGLADVVGCKFRGRADAVLVLRTARSLPKVCALIR